MRRFYVLIFCLFVLAACGGDETTPTPINALIPTVMTPVPTSTDTPVPSETTVPSVTPVPTATTEVIEIMPAPGQEVAPPLTIDLPGDWQFQHAVQQVQDLDGLRLLPFTLYQGPVTDGIGTIVLLWAVPDVGINPNPIDPSMGATFSLWADATRMLRLAIFEVGCNIGTGPETTFRVGGREVVGGQFAAVDCPDAPDTNGWFAALKHEGLTFIFYVYGEPIEIMAGTAPREMQAILDTVEFQQIVVTATPAP